MRFPGMHRFSDSASVMRRALELAARGIGAVEPNPPVGAVVVNDDLELLGEGYHERCGGPHAEVHALAAAGERARGATLYVTLEPCAHFGRTPPCAPLVVQSGVRRVVIAVEDPAEHTSGAGLQILREAGIDVEIGLLAEEGRRLIAPFTKLMTRGMPYVHAKWAMTLDGRIATRTGSSRWISGEESRRIVHKLRGRMDAIIVGIGTAVADDPLLTARPPGPRTPARVVVDREARLPLESRLVQSASDGPVVAVVGDAPQDRCDALRRAGIEVLNAGVEDCQGATRVDLPALLRELGRRRMTNVLIEGGGRLLGSAVDAGLVDESHIFLAPKLVGGRGAPGPVGGEGVADIADALVLEEIEVVRAGGDIYVRGRIAAD